MRWRRLLFAVLAAVTAVAGYYLYDETWGRAADHRAAVARYNAGDFAGATELLDRYLAVRPRDAEAHLLAARAVRRGLVPELAGEGDERVVGLPPGAGGARGAFDDHLAAFERHGGPAEVALFERTLWTVQRGDLTGAEGALQKVSRDPIPEAALALEGLALGYILTFQLPAALDCLTRWLDRGETTRALLWRGRVYERMRNRDAALVDYRRAVQRDPGDADGRRALGVLLLETNQYAEAETHFQALADLRHGDPAARLGAARSAAGRGDTDRARRSLDELLADHPDMVRAMVERAKLATDGEDLLRAERQLRRALTLAPGETTALYALAQCLRRQGRDPDADAVHAQFVRAEADLTRVGELIGQLAERPRDPALRSEIGRLFLANHREQEGLRWFATALESDPTHQPTLAALADHYERAGDRSRAEYYRRRIKPASDRPPPR